MRPYAVPTSELDEWLPQIQWHLQSFADCGQWSVTDFEDQLRRQEKQLWLAINDQDEIKGVVLTAIANDRRSTLHVTHGAGTEFRDWVGLLPSILDWGSQMGCQTIEVTCRPGWERFLKKLGMKKTHVVLEAEL